MDALPIRTNHSPQGTRWHSLSRDSLDFTEGMNAHGGVLVRTCVEFAEYPSESIKPASLSLVFVSGCQVGQRWSIQIVEEDPAEGVKGCIMLQRETALVGSLTLAEQDGDLLRGRKFRWYSADEFMPEPTDTQVRHLAKNICPPSDADALRNDLERARETIAQLRGFGRDLIRARLQRDYLLPSDASWSSALAHDGRHRSAIVAELMEIGEQHIEFVGIDTEELEEIVAEMVPA